MRDLLGRFLSEGIPGTILPTPLELLAGLGIEFRCATWFDDQRLRFSVTSDSNATYHVGPLPKQKLYSRYNLRTNDPSKTIPIIHYYEFMLLEFSPNQGVKIHSIPGTMPRLDYQTLTIAEYGRRLREIRNQTGELERKVSETE